MNKRLLALLAIIGLCVMVGLLVASSHSRSSVYQGKTVKAWLFQLIAADPKARVEAEAAFEALGTNAVPELTRLAQAKDAGWRKLIWVHAAKLPPRVRARVLQRIGHTNACVIRPMAAQALGRLGPNAAPAVPALIEMMKQGNPMEQQVAADSLAKTGAPGLAALINVVVHEDGGAGCAAALALLRNYPWPGLGCPVGENTPSDQMASARQQVLETLGPRAKTNQVVIHVLARAVLDPAPGVRLAALKALARADRNLQPVLQQLVACSEDESAAIRELSARTLGKIGPPAKDAIPALTELAQDKEEAVRRVAQESLQTIRAGRTTDIQITPK